MQGIKTERGLLTEPGMFNVYTAEEAGLWVELKNASAGEGGGNRELGSGY